MALHLFERIAVDDSGEGPEVVCVHGLGGSANTFEPLLPALARHRVVRIELPGSARSWRAEGPLSIARFVDAVAMVCDRLAIAGAHLLGHSLGSIVCQHLAVAQPARVKSLALFGPLLAPADSARAAIRSRAAKAREGVVGMHEICAALLQSALSAQTREQSPLAVAFVRESLQRQDADGYARSCEALADAQPAAVDGIVAPVLLVTGDEDAVAPPQAVRALAEKLHRSRRVDVVVLSRCGHWTPIERPQECRRALGDFLAAHSRS